MSAQGGALPVLPQDAGIDQMGKWFWSFLKAELTPYPGRTWVVGRMTISATLVMLLVLTFRIPAGFLGVIFTVIISRENPTETFLGGLRVVAVFLVGTAYTIFSVRMLIDDPMTHFLWVAGSVFLCFYLLRVVDYSLAASFGFTILGAVPLWDQTTLPAETRLENTLWLAGVVSLSVFVSVVVEYVFRKVHPTTDLTEGIEIRMQTVEHTLRSAATGQPLESEWEKRLSFYSMVGTSRLRRLILRSRYTALFKAQMSTAIALTGRLVDIAASFHLALAERAKLTGKAIDDAGRERCRRLADDVAVLAQDLMLQRLPQEVSLPAEPQTMKLPFLAEMERTVTLIPQAFAESKTVRESVAAPLDEIKSSRLFVSDAFSNPAYVQFALRGTLAAMVCYILYTSINWPGLSTSMVTCFITALSTIGSSRQKQILRLGGTAIGGFIFGMGAQVFLLPYIDSVVGFTVLFAVVTAIAAWIATASARISYLGVQLIFAFCLVNLQEFAIQTSLSVARDRVFGVLLGLLSMWLVFDRLQVRNALDEMQTVFARDFELFAELTEQLLEPDHIKAIRRIRQLRDQILDGFQAVIAQSDAILFEFGPSRRRNLQIREDFRRWQPSLRTLLLVQMTSAQYRGQTPVGTLPKPLAEAVIEFEGDIARVMRAMANLVREKPVESVPDIRLSAARIKQVIHDYHQDANLQMTDRASDFVNLYDSLASILSPLYQDIYTTFTGTPQTTGDKNGLPEGAV
jgi:multidrug resistance protein MdtO